MSHQLQQPAETVSPRSALEDYIERRQRESYTSGDYLTETEAAAALDAALAGSGLWSVYSEVRGSLCQPRPAQPGKNLRIDRVLVPNQRLRDLGWAHGVIGVEIKRSNIKIGPPIAQAMDYSRAVWTLSELGSIRVWLDWVFIWPMPKQHETTASILAQNRIGSASCDRWSSLRLQSGEQNLITIRHDGTTEIGNAAVNGRKAGSR